MDPRELSTLASAADRPRAHRKERAIALVTVMWANNEVSTVEPIPDHRYRCRIRYPRALGRGTGTFGAIDDFHASKGDPHKSQTAKSVAPWASARSCSRAVRTTPSTTGGQGTLRALGTIDAPAWQVCRSRTRFSTLTKRSARIAALLNELIAWSRAHPQALLGRRKSITENTRPEATAR